MAVYPKPNNPNVCKVALVFNRDTRTAINTFHVWDGAGWTITTMTALANLVKTWYTNTYAGILPPAVALAQIQVRLYNPALPLAVDLALVPPVAGSRAGTPEAANVSLTMSERTGLAGKAYRGRMYLPGMLESDCSADDRASSLLVTAASNVIANLISTMSGAGHQLTIFHRPGLIPKPLDNLTTHVLTYVVENILDSQRRRLPARGR